MQSAKKDYMEGKNEMEEEGTGNGRRCIRNIEELREGDDGGTGMMCNRKIRSTRRKQIKRNKIRS
jgi:hypothetical protein